MSSPDPKDNTEKFKKLIAEKNEEKKFPPGYIQKIYEIESQYVNNKTRLEAQKKIRQLIFEITPDDVEDQKKINEEAKEK